jgi:hypothetical protein
MLLERNTRRRHGAWPMCWGSVGDGKGAGAHMPKNEKISAINHMAMAMAEVHSAKVR